MQFAKIQLKPGINREQTRYANSGGWFDCDMVRFNAGLPEKIGGWQPYNADAPPFIGTARSLIVWHDNVSHQCVGFGTNAKYYAFFDGNLNDITPIRATATLPAASLSTVSGSNTIKVVHFGHAAVEQDYFVVTNAVGFNGVPTAELNGEHQVTRRIDADSFEYKVTTNATATGTGGGTPTFTYQINFGLDQTFVGTGWGAGIYGGPPDDLTPEGAADNIPDRDWGESADSGVIGNVLRLWSQDTFGEDLIFCYNGGPLYYWDVTSPTTRAVQLTGTQVPFKVRRVIVSERHVIAFACTPLGANPVGVTDADKEDPMLVRWSDQEDATNWQPDVINAAGDYRLTVGSRIVSAVRCRQEILILTDEALYSMRYIGGQYIYSFELIGASTTIISPNALVAMDDKAFWMGTDNFYAYDGRITQLDCSVSDYIFGRLNIAQRFKTFGGSNTGYGEITFFYSSVGSDENDSSVTYNYLDRIWYYNSLARSAWADTGSYPYPIGADPVTRKLYAHEFGEDDRSTNPPSPIHARIRSSPFEIQDGYKVSFITRLIPDITFRNLDLAHNPYVKMTLTPQNWPGSTEKTPVVTTVQRGVTVNVEQFTTQKPVRLRGRAMTIDVESNIVGIGWRLGTPRIEIRADGRR